jgi:hypothetical protein
MPASDVTLDRTFDAQHAAHGVPHTASPVLTYIVMDSAFAQGKQELLRYRNLT